MMEDAAFEEALQAARHLIADKDEDALLELWECSDGADVTYEVWAAVCEELTRLRAAASE